MAEMTREDIAITQVSFWAEGFAQKHDCTFELDNEQWVWFLLRGKRIAGYTVECFIDMWVHNDKQYFASIVDELIVAGKAEGLTSHPADATH